jgi:tRNA threonylcarbamoyladenosine biosynthesis protein TsaB
MLLAIDSCGSLGGVALGRFSESGMSDVWTRELGGRTFSEQLLPAVAGLLSDASVQLSELSGLVVVRGPGSFTGIRIGVSAAKGLAEGLAIPVVALSRLELLARQSRDGSAVAVLDAGRGEFFAGFYREGVCEGEALLTHDALSQAVAGSGLPVLVCEDGVFSALGSLEASLVAAPAATDALAVGGVRFLAGSFDDVGTLEANYLRRSESEMLARIAGHAARKAETAAVAK